MIDCLASSSLRPGISSSSISNIALAESRSLFSLGISSSSFCSFLFASSSWPASFVLTSMRIAFEPFTSFSCCCACSSWALGSCAFSSCHLSTPNSVFRFPTSHISFLLAEASSLSLAFSLSTSLFAFLSLACSSSSALSLASSSLLRLSSYLASA